MELGAELVLTTLQWDEAFDIGSDTLTDVNDDDYQPPFPLTAKLEKLTIKIDRPQLSQADIQKLEDAMQRASDLLAQRVERLPTCLNRAVENRMVYLSASSEK